MSSLSERLQASRMRGNTEATVDAHNRSPSAHGGNHIVFAFAESQSIATSTFVVVTPAAVLDPTGLYSSGIVTIKEPGLYRISLSVYWTPRLGNAPHLLASVWINQGSGYTERARASAPGNTAATGQGSCVYLPFALDAGDLVKFQVYQDGGSTINAEDIQLCVELIRAL